MKNRQLPPQNEVSSTLETFQNLIKSLNDLNKASQGNKCCQEVYKALDKVLQTMIERVEEGAQQGLPASVMLKPFREVLYEEIFKKKKS